MQGSGKEGPPLGVLGLRATSVRDADLTELVDYLRLRYRLVHVSKIKRIGRTAFLEVTAQSLQVQGRRID